MVAVLLAALSATPAKAETAIFFKDKSARGSVGAIPKGDFFKPTAIKTKSDPRKFYVSRDQVINVTRNVIPETANQDLILLTPRIESVPRKQLLGELLTTTVGRVENFIKWGIENGVTLDHDNDGGIDELRAGRTWKF